MIVPPVLDSFRDPDSGVRYYGLEALYNIAKVSRESFLRYFSDTFDSLFRLCADSENRVQVCLRLSPLALQPERTSNSIRSRQLLLLCFHAPTHGGQARSIAHCHAVVSPVPSTAASCTFFRSVSPQPLPVSQQLRSDEPEQRPPPLLLQNAAMILDNMIKDIVAASNNFDIDSFIPRLARFLAVPHMPNKRRFLIDWTSLLQSVPDIDMLSYLPNLLDGMMNMLSDNHTEIRTAAARTLDNFLRQVRLSRSCADRAALTFRTCVHTPLAPAISCWPSPICLSPHRRRYRAAVAQLADPTPSANACQIPPHNPRCRVQAPSAGLHVGSRSAGRSRAALLSPHSRGGVRSRVEGA